MHVNADIPVRADIDSNGNPFLRTCNTFPICRGHGFTVSCG